jgi:thiol-disulfide isomerase/thioredoxin
MKAIFFVAVVLFSCFAAKAQQKESAPVRSLWNTSPKELRTGDKMPDVPFGEVMNDLMGKARFSQLKGKLVILDFWNSNCSPCIAAFPEMEKLQKEFGNQIQIILVNPQQTREEILAQQAIRGFYLPSSLPSIVNATNIEQYFPSKGETGYHVWIDGKGVVRLRGNGHLNTYPEKINKLLSGKDISFIPDENIQLNKQSQSLFQLYGKAASPLNVQYSSSIYKFNAEYKYYGANLTTTIDSITGTSRMGYYNQDIQSLYLSAVKNNKVLQSEWAQILNGRSSLSPRLEVEKTTMLEVKDPALYSLAYATSSEVIDQWYMNNKFSYEQITPVIFSDTLRREYMLEDLNRFFGGLYRTEGKIEQRLVDCYVLVQKIQNDNLATKTTESGIKQVMRDGKKMMGYYNWNLRAVLKVYGIQLDWGHLLFIDETGIKNKVDIELQENIPTVEALKQALQPYGLDIISETRKRSFLVLNEKK